MFFGLLGEFMQHARGYGRGMRPEDVSGSFLLGPLVSVPDGPVAARLVNVFDPFHVVAF